MNKLIRHLKGAPGLRLFGMGPDIFPTKGIKKLKALLDENTFWAKGRSEKNLKRLLANSSSVISIWDKKRIIGFGRATSDTVYRAVIWDVVVANDKQGLGIGRMIIKELLQSKDLINVRKIYLMTTHKSEFYSQQGFKRIDKQQLFCLLKDEKA